MLIFLLENKNWETKKLIGKMFFTVNFTVDCKFQQFSLHLLHLTSILVYILFGTHKEHV